MPTIADYLRLAPYSLDELVGAVNGCLRAHPRLGVARRTLRYYVAQGVLPPPSGPPKFARYDGDHLLRALVLRTASATGRTLAEAAREADALLRLPPEGAAREIEARIAGVDDRAIVSEQSAAYEEEEIAMSSPAPAPMPRANAPVSRERSVAKPVLRVRLAPGITLEISGSELARGPLQRAAHEIRRLLDSF